MCVEGGDSCIPLSHFPPYLPEPDFKLLRSPEIESKESASLCSLAGRYDNPIPLFPAPIDCSKILAQLLPSPSSMAPGRPNS